MGVAASRAPWRLSECNDTWIGRVTGEFKGIVTPERLVSMVGRRENRKVGLVEACLVIDAENYGETGSDKFGKKKKKKRPERAVQVAGHLEKSDPRSDSTDANYERRI
jgi:hypothetical protein